jgi:hypothetical protein
VKFRASRGSRRIAEKVNVTCCPNNSHDKGASFSERLLSRFQNPMDTCGAEGSLYDAHRLLLGRLKFLAFGCGLNE